MDNYNPLPSISLLLSCACLQCTLTYLLTLSSRAPGPYYPTMLLPYALLVFLADRVFLRRERTVRGLTLLNGGLCAAALLSILLLGGVADLAGGIMAGVFCLWLAVRASQLAQKSPKLFELILEVDLSLVMLAVFTAYLSITGRSVSWCLPITVGCACSILGTIVFRSGTNLGPRSWTFLTVTFAGVLAMVWLLVSFVAAPAGEGLITLWHWTVAAARFLLNLLLQLMIFLASLLPAPEVGQPIEPGASQPAFPMEEQFQNDSIIPLLLLAALAVGAVVLVLLLLRTFGRLRLLAVRAKSESAPLHRRVSLLAALRRLLAGWGRWAARRIWLWRNRDTPEGLYFLLILRSGHTPWHKLPGETPREFLSRLRSQASDDPQLIQALDALIPAVDRALFSSCVQEPPIPQARLLRCRMGAAVRQRMMRDALSGLRLSLNRSSKAKTT